MSTFLPTMRVSILRGSHPENTYGDRHPSTAVTANGVPAAAVETAVLGGSQTSFVPADERGGVVERYTVRLRPGTDVTENDRLVDEATGAVYQVLSVYQPQSSVGLSDVRVSAVRTGATSQPVNG